MLTPLLPFREKLTFVRGLRNPPGGPGIHSSQTGNLLTGTILGAGGNVRSGVSFDQGLRLADKIHNAGRAVVWSGHKEPAELYWETLRGYGLTMAPLEPAA